MLYHCQGVNAALSAKSWIEAGRPSISEQKNNGSGEWRPFVLDRTNSYIGVLIDDLTKKGTMEPYRYLLQLTLINLVTLYEWM